MDNKLKEMDDFFHGERTNADNKESPKNLDFSNMSISEKVKIITEMYDNPEKEGKERGKKTREIIAERLGIAPFTVTRYYKLKNLNDSFMNLLSRNELSFNQAYELSNLSLDKQIELYQNFVENKLNLSISNIRAYEIGGKSHTPISSSHEARPEQGIWIDLEELKAMSDTVREISLDSLKDIVKKILEQHLQNELDSLGSNNKKQKGREDYFDKETLEENEDLFNIMWNKSKKKE